MDLVFSSWGNIRVLYVTLRVLFTTVKLMKFQHVSFCISEIFFLFQTLSGALVNFGRSRFVVQCKNLFVRKDITVFKTRWRDSLRLDCPAGVCLFDNLI